jgi:hypothetical protein
VSVLKSEESDSCRLWLVSEDESSDEEVDDDTEDEEQEEGNDDEAGATVQYQEDVGKRCRKGEG